MSIQLENDQDPGSKFSLALPYVVKAMIPTVVGVVLMANTVSVATQITGLVLTVFGGSAALTVVFLGMLAKNTSDFNAIVSRAFSKQMLTRVFLKAIPLSLALGIAGAY